LSVAAALAVFLLYTSLAGGSTPSLQPSQLADHAGVVTLGGLVVGKPVGDAYGSGLRFTVRDPKGTTTVPVVYRGSVPDMFKSGRDVYMKGTLQNGVFVAQKDSMVTKCPSKYSAKS
jgi:cytochrome c-type biogenesis protein CcmE